MVEIQDNLIKILDDLITNTGVNSSSIITEDGLIIASDSKQDERDEEININFAAISASILSIAERGIEIINTNKILEQIVIDAGTSTCNGIETDFIILVTRVYSNVLLLVIFPKRINIGLIQFETNKLITMIKNKIKEDSSREVFTSIGSLL